MHWADIFARAEGILKQSRRRGFVFLKGRFMHNCMLNNSFFTLPPVPPPRSSPFSPPSKGTKGADSLVVVARMNQYKHANALSCPGSDMHSDKARIQINGNGTTRTSRRGPEGPSKATFRFLKTIISGHPATFNFGKTGVIL